MSAWGRSLRSVNQPSRVGVWVSVCRLIHPWAVVIDQHGMSPLSCIQHVRDDRFSFAYSLLSATYPRVESRRKQKKQKEATMILSGKQDLALYYKSVLSQG